MKIKMPFGLDSILTDENARLNAEKNTYRGVWPLQMNDVWHTAIHLKPEDSANTCIDSILPGEVIASRLCEDYRTDPIYNAKYSTSFVLMKHYFSFGKTKVPFYLLYSNLATKKFIDNNEFLISKKNKNEAYEFRPVFFKEWNLKDDSVKKEKLKILAYYDNPQFSGNPKGYLNRDSRLFIYKTKNGTYYRKFNDNNKYYIKNLTSLNNKNTNYYTLSKKNDTNYNQKITIYYDSECNYEKFSFDLPSKDIFLKAKPTASNRYIYIKFNEQSYTNLFYSESFYITINKELTKNSTFKIKSNIELNKIGNNKKNNSAITIGLNGYENVNQVKCFVGDALKVQSEEINTCSGYHQYLVKKTYANCDIEKEGYYYQQGYFKGLSSPHTIDSIVTTIQTYELRNNELQNKNNLYEMDNLVKVYDKSDKSLTKGITLYPAGSINKNTVYEVLKKDNKYFALIQLKSLSNYYNQSLFTDGENKDSFYGYVELKVTQENNNNDFLSERIESKYKVIKKNSESHNKENVITETFENIGSNYNGIIGYYDGENDLDLHLELFFTSLDAFKFKKKKKSFNGTNDVEEFLEIKNGNNIFRASNSLHINDTIYKNSENENYCFNIKGNSSIEKLFVQKNSTVKYILKKSLFGSSIEIKGNKLGVKIKNDKNNSYFIFKKDFKSNDYNIEKKKKYKIIDNSTFLLPGKEEETNYYIIVSDISEHHDSFSLSENTVIYEGIIQLENVDANEKIYLNEKSFLYFNCDNVNINETNYTRFNSEGNIYFIKESDIETKSVSPYYEESAQKVANGNYTDVLSSIKYNISDLPNFILVEEMENTETKYSDYLCDIQNILERTKLKEYLLKQENEDVDFKKLKQEGKYYSEIIYSNLSLYKELSRLIIKCPSMWEEPEKWDNEKDDYLKNTAYIGLVDKKSVQDYIKEQFFFKTGSDIKNKLFATDNTQYYYFHPLEFLKYYSKTHQEYCPYFGEVMYDFPSSSVGGVSFVKDTPGFAPFDNGIYDGYVASNGHFNEDYGKVHPTYQYYYHEGVDFAAEMLKPIHSFIYGSVIDFGLHVSMGGYMIVKDLFDSNKYYLLLHIKDKSWENYSIKKGTIVYPGMTVAKVWTQLTNIAYHLHVSVIQLEDGEIPIPDSSKKEPVIRDANIRFPVWKDKYKKRMRNPFKHDETWGGRN